MTCIYPNYIIWYSASKGGAALCTRYGYAAYAAPPVELLVFIMVFADGASLHMSSNAIL